MKSSRIPNIMLGLLAVASLLTTAAITAAVFSRDAPAAWAGSPVANTLPVLFDVPAFILTDENGQTVTRGDLAGKVWVADFIFTRCQSICPLLTAQMAALQNKLKQDRAWSDVRLVSFSVDPEHDQPDVLRAYAQTHHADLAHWSFLTGKRSELWKLARNGFKLPVQPNAQDAKSLILHSGKWVLVDRQGRIRGYYDGLDAQDRAKLLDDLHTLLRHGDQSS